MKILSSVTEPADLWSLDHEELSVLAAEIRSFLIETVCRTGGHLGPSLGVVELTLALHRVFRSPRDRIIWDTGHQAYVHKIVTGRRERFGELRRRNGISGYPSRSESEHDLVENSHASTALSYAYGIAAGDALSGRDDRRTVAVIGDGALTGGMAWEALNTIAERPERGPVLVVNDNGRSYGPTVGGLARHLDALRRGDGPPGGLFAALGLRYIGPVDGHDVRAVEQALRDAAQTGAATVVHCITSKGRGYELAEADEADRFHAVGPMDPRTGRPYAVPARTWTEVFSEELLRHGEESPQVVAITAAMLDSTGLGRFAARFPERTFDVGIAEQHAVTSSAALAMSGFRPVVAVYAAFLNRAVDQVLMDVALHSCPVVFVLDRAGVTGDDGPSHNGMWDLSLLAIVPGLQIAAPRDARTLRRSLSDALAHDGGPSVIRFPKGAVPADIPALCSQGALEFLRVDPVEEVLFVAVGSMAQVCLDAASLLEDSGVGSTVVDPCWIRPIDPVLVGMAARFALVVVVEDNLRVNGFGTMLAAALDAAGVATPLVSHGVPLRFLDQGKRAEVLQDCGLTAPIVAADTLCRAASPVGAL